MGDVPTSVGLPYIQRDGVVPTSCVKGQLKVAHAYEFPDLGQPHADPFNAVAPSCAALAWPNCSGLRLSSEEVRRLSRPS